MCSSKHLNLGEPRSEKSNNFRAKSCCHVVPKATSDAPNFTLREDLSSRSRESIVQPPEPLNDLSSNVTETSETSRAISNGRLFSEGPEAPLQLDHAFKENEMAIRKAKRPNKLTIEIPQTHEAEKGPLKNLTFLHNKFELPDKICSPRNPPNSDSKAEVALDDSTKSNGENQQQFVSFPEENQTTKTSKEKDPRRETEEWRFRAESDEGKVEPNPTIAVKLEFPTGKLNRVKSILTRPAKLKDGVTQPTTVPGKGTAIEGTSSTTTKYFKAGATGKVPKYLQRKISRALTSKTGTFTPGSSKLCPGEGNSSFSSSASPSTDTPTLQCHFDNNKLSNEKGKKKVLRRLFSKKELANLSTLKKRPSAVSLRRVGPPKPPLRRSYSVCDVALAPTAKDLERRGAVFGRDLNDLCAHEDGIPPFVVVVMLRELLRRGPAEIGVFRKSANARVVRELKVEIDAGHCAALDSASDIPINTIAALFKDFLRSLPDCLMRSGLYSHWLQVTSLTSKQDKMERIWELCSLLPSCHLCLLKLTVFILRSIADNAENNLMTSSNLAVCIGPSILNSGVCDFNFDQNVPGVLEFFIDNFRSIFGAEEHYLSHFLSDPISELFSVGQKLLAQTNQMSNFTLSKDSGISSLFSLTSEEDSDLSEIFASHPSSPGSFTSEPPGFSFDEVDGCPLETRKLPFNRDDWMRRGSVIRKINRRIK